MDLNSCFNCHGRSFENTPTQAGGMTRSRFNHALLSSVVMISVEFDGEGASHLDRMNGGMPPASEIDGPKNDEIRPIKSVALSPIDVPAKAAILTHSA